MLWCQSLGCYASYVSTLNTVFTTGDNLAHGGGVSSGVLCECIWVDLPRSWETQIPPHLVCLTISQHGSVEFLCNNHASPVFSKHCACPFARLTHFSGKHQAVSVVNCVTLLHLTFKCKQTEQWDSPVIRPSQALPFKVCWLSYKALCFEVVEVLIS